MKLDLDALEALEKKAAPSPWESYHGSVLLPGEDYIDCFSPNGHTGELIAALRNAAPQLIAECKAAREWLRTTAFLEQALNEEECEFEIELKLMGDLQKAYERYRALAEGWK